jgi:hypothetical protein
VVGEHVSQAHDGDLHESILHLWVDALVQIRHLHFRQERIERLLHHRRLQRLDVIGQLPIVATDKLDGGKHFAAAVARLLAVEGVPLRIGEGSVVVAEIEAGVFVVEVQQTAAKVVIPAYKSTRQQCRAYSVQYTVMFFVNATVPVICVFIVQPNHHRRREAAIGRKH